MITGDVYKKGFWGSGKEVVLQNGTTIWRCIEGVKKWQDDVSVM